ncbi:MAG: hypothetical protein HQL45_00885 [Alphaproteobacteria bacterium]|nr:hypothetical protein [Alphaproteobacteria bacterium]
MTRQLNAAPMWLFGGLAAVVVMSWAYVVFVVDLAYWYHGNEFAELTMGYAINIDQWLTESIGKGRRSILNNYVSPALPHQLSGWLAFRLADGVNFTKTADLATATLNDPSRVFLIQRLLVLGLSLFALSRLFILARPLGASAAMAVAAALFIYQPNWEYGVFFLDDPSFGPIAGALFTLALLSTLGRFQGEAKARDWLWLGFVGIGAYSIKMHYIAWLLAAGGGLAAAVLVGRLTWRQGIGAALWILLGIVLGLEILAFFLDGKFTHRDIMKMLSFHASIVFGAETKNLPGAGQDQVFSQTLPYQAGILFFMVVAIGSGMTLALFRRRSDMGFIRRTLPMATVLVLVYASGFVMFLKFPSLKYLVSTAALLPAGVYWLCQCWEGARWQRFLALPVMAFALIAGLGQIGEEQERKAVENRMRMARQDILALPLAQGEFRLWSYRVLTPEYNIRLALQWSGDRNYDALVGDRVLPDDREYNVWKGEVRINREWHRVTQVPWRYAVFPGQLEESGLPQPFQGGGHRIVHMGDISLVERGN